MGWAQLIGTGIEANKDTYTRTNGTQTTQKAFTQEGLNQLVYTVLSGDNGLASLASGENASGGFGSSVKSQLAQDMVVKLAGELANLTAATTTSSSSQQDVDNTDPLNKFFGGGGGSSGKTIICTHLAKRGFLNKELWKAGTPYLMNLPERTVKGYHFWAEPVVQYMEKNPNGWMEKFWIPIVQARYEMVVNKKFSLLGASTIYIMEPFSYVIGFFLGVPNGRFANAI